MHALIFILILCTASLRITISIDNYGESDTHVFLVHPSTAASSSKPRPLQFILLMQNTN